MRVTYIGPILVMKLEKDNAIGSWRELMGPTDPIVAKKESPNSIRALYGKNSSIIDKSKELCLAL